ncbi:MAG: BamA/TamA family outer membrane protein [Bacteroidota bacterium]
MRPKLGKYLFWALLFSSLWSCQSTRYIKPGEIMVKNVPTFEGNEALSATKLLGISQLETNRRVIYPKAYLHLHNFGIRIQKDSSFTMRTIRRIGGIRRFLDNTSNWLRNGIGETPVLLDTSIVREDLSRLRNAYFANGYFYPQISYRIDTLKDGKKANVVYQIDEGVPFRIHSVDVSSPNGAIGWAESAYHQEESLLKEKALYNHEKMALERSRAVEAMRNEGYFTFAPSMIDVWVDTISTAHLADTSAKWLNLRIDIKEEPPRYRIRKIIFEIKAPAQSGVRRDSVSFRAAELNDEMRKNLGIGKEKLRDSTKITFVVDRSAIRRINYEFLSARVGLEEGKLYRIADARQTQQRLQELGMFQFVLTSFSVIKATNELDVRIETQLSARYQVKFGTEGFTENLRFAGSNLPSLGAQLSFRNRNAFHKSETFNLELLGNIGLYDANQTGGQFDNLFYKFSGLAELNFDRFFIPLVPIRFAESRLSPQTSMSINIQEENRVEFDRLNFGAQLSYRWNHIPFKDKSVSRLTPLSMDFVDIDTDSAFQADFVDPLPEALRNDFVRRFSTRTTYSYTQQTYGRSRAYPTYWFRVSAELGGNLAYLLDNIGGLSDQDSLTNDNLLFNRLFYGQYGKVSVENKWMFPIDAQSEFVVRGLLGMALPYNNAPTVPYDSRFFTGGTNGMRGWVSNTLGPGRSSVSDFQGTNSENPSSLIAPGGEIVFELNAEYRVDVAQYLEVALFTDLGNVWFHNSPTTREQLGEKSVFSFDNLRLGWDAGFGFRFDFSFLILRLDIGQQLYAPDLERGWILGNPEGDERRLQFNLGLGYPF